MSFDFRDRPKLHSSLLIAAIARWPKAHRVFFRDLLDTHPNEAHVLAALAFELDAVPDGEPPKAAEDEQLSLVA